MTAAPCPICGFPGDRCPRAARLRRCRRLLAGASRCDCAPAGNLITAMDTPGLEVVRTALEPLCGSLHDVFSASVVEANRIRANSGLSASVYSSMGADVTRAIAHRRLTTAGDVGGWTLGGKHHLRGQVMLIRGMMRLRFLHEPNLLVPPPGANRSRRAYYRNIPLGQISAFDAESSSLVAIWRVEDPEWSSISFRVVRPISDRGRWSGPRTEVDLDFPLPDLSETLASLEFEQVDEGLLLDLPDEDLGRGDDAAPGDVR